MKKILVIGSNGQVGQSLINKSKQLNINLIGLSKDQLDITNSNQLQDTINRLQPDAIINTSAYHVLNDCEENPQQAFLVNSICLKELAKICLEKNIRLVHFSSDYVFDGKKHSPYTENDKTNPLQIYGISKLAGEKICLNYNPNSLIIRTSSIFGGVNGSRSKGGNFVLMILNQAKKLSEMEVAKNQFMSPTYSDDLAVGTLTLLAKNPTPGIYHLTNNGSCTWANFAKTIVKLQKLKLKIRPVNRDFYKQNPRRPAFSVLSNKKVAQYKIKLPNWEEGLKEYLKELNLSR